MGHIKQRGNGVLNVMTGPVGVLAVAYHAAQGHGAGPHDIGPGDIVLGLLDSDTGRSNHAAHQRFR